MVFKVLLLQLVTVGIVVFVLKHILEHELVMHALEHLEGFEPAAGEDVREVTILVGRALPEAMAARLRKAVRLKFPQAETSIVVSREIGGGAVLQMGGKVLDFSLAGRLKHLWWRGRA
jgi:F0F1-type ATP synthase delta subunit